MRAKEYISLHREEIKHIELVAKVLEELKPIRLDKKATDDYYNRVLSADIRKQTFLLQEELYKRSNAMQQDKPEYVECAGEVPIEIAAEVRQELFTVIREDESYGYLFFQLGNEHNSKHSSDPIDCIPNSDKIAQAIDTYRDNYPQQSMDNYLDDEFNYAENEDLLQNGYSDVEEDKRLEIFNQSYRLYDNLRCTKSSLSKSKEQLAGIGKEGLSERDTSYILKMASDLINRFSSGDSQLKRISNEIQKELNKRHFYGSSDTLSKNEKGMTTQQIVLISYYVLNEFDVNFANTDKSSIIRFIHEVFGRNEQDIKEKLNFNYDDKNVKKSLKAVMNVIKPLLPRIATKIENDLKE